MRKPGVTACVPEGDDMLRQPHEDSALLDHPPRGDDEERGPDREDLSLRAYALPPGGSGPSSGAGADPGDGADPGGGAESGEGGKAPGEAQLRERAAAIRAAVKHAWDGYRSRAWGKDELKPISGQGADKNFRHAVTMVDSLDTLWIVGLKREFHEAKDWLATHLPGKLSSMAKGVSLFETTIRSLGGLLSAYDLSGEAVFLNLAKQLGSMINEKVSNAGIAPYTFGGGVGGARCNSIVDSGTLQLEMRYLAHVSGDPSFCAKSDRFYETIQNTPSFDGLYPLCWQKNVGKVSFGADGDSFYEYLVKVWLQGGQKPEDEKLWEMFDDAVTGMERHLVQKGTTDGLTYVHIGRWDAHTHSMKLTQEMEHLVCFVPGWIALGAMTDRGEATREHRMALAESIAYTCWQMYDRQATKIAPERVKMMDMSLRQTNTREYILRPEALESWWYLHELTGKDIYRDWGWKTFQAFERKLRAPFGYASLKDVSEPNTQQLDRMESFFIAETLKYAYMLQDPDNKITLDRYVLNTEAHPLSKLEFARAPSR